MKDFTAEFEKIKNLIVSDTPFAFSKFSDGEVSVLQNNTIVLAKDHFIQGDLHGDETKLAGSYLPEERKEFVPAKHEFFHKKLIEAFKFRKKNYFKGIPAQNASYGDVSWKFCTELYGKGDEEHLSFANLLLNANYHRFITEVLPLFADKSVVVICNENADLSELPFPVVKDFRCGTNCMINNYNMIGEVSKWVEDHDVTEHLFLFSASTLSNYLIYNLYKNFDTNQYLDIGSALGYHFKLKGCYLRGYLDMYWNKGLLLNEIDIWN
tara:strand:+ start:168 stop:968 length:801 start_codon:yes stop_codon:yes gene_type:complete